MTFQLFLQDHFQWWTCRKPLEEQMDSRSQMSLTKRMVKKRRCLMKPLKLETVQMTVQVQMVQVQMVPVVVKMIPAVFLT